jgi:hypothetical protein
MSDTPETDWVSSIEGNWDTKALRMTDFARKLERERDMEMKRSAKLRKVSLRAIELFEFMDEENDKNGVALQLRMDIEQLKKKTK